MKEKFICSICGKDYNDLNNYMNCVTSCCKKKLNENAKKLEEINTFISKVKAAEKYLTEVKKEFETKYPEEYKLNFGVRDTERNAQEDDLDNWLEEFCRDKKPSITTVSYEDNGKDKPTIKVNGKITDKNLADDPDTRWIAEMLGLVK